MITEQVVNQFDEECESMPELISVELQNEFMPTSVRSIVESLESNKRAEIIFENIEGIRVLDEGDLLEFWEEDSRSFGWLWKIKQGGWYDLELNRQSSFTLKTLPKGLKEFLIAGSSKCLNVICYGEPIVKIINEHNNK